MKYNKGFAPLAILLIVLGVLAVGGVAYFAGKSSAPKNELIDNQNYIPPITNNNPPQQQIPPPTPTCNPSITVLSPNGGEVYHVGQTITVKWKSCNLPSNDLVNINFMRSSNVHVVTTPDASNQFPIGNGSAQITVTATGVYPTTVQYGNIYKILLDVVKPSSRDTGTLDAQDWSDNYFTINGHAVSTVLPQYVGTHADCGGPSQCWPPIITTSSQSYSCNNIGVAPNTDGNDITEQRVINGRTYCIHSLSDGYTGGRGYTYTYMTSNGNGTKIATFGLMYQSCGVYGAPATPTAIQCKSNQTTFNNNLDARIDSLM